MSKGKVAAIAAGGVLAIAAAITAKWEGYKPDPYFDAVNVLTVCYGTTQNVQMRRYSRAECEAFLERDLKEAQAHVRRCIKVEMPDYTEAAFISASYNIGPKVVCGSTLQRKANAGDLKGACAELSKWVYAGGKRLLGLERRRADERRLCEGRI